MTITIDQPSGMEPIAELSTDDAMWSYGQPVLRILGDSPYVPGVYGCCDVLMPVLALAFDPVFGELVGPVGARDYLAQRCTALLHEGAMTPALAALAGKWGVVEAGGEFVAGG